MTWFHVQTKVLVLKMVMVMVMVMVMAMVLDLVKPPILWPQDNLSSYHYSEAYPCIAVMGQS